MEDAKINKEITVLIVEDDVTMLKELENVLVENSLTVKVASNQKLASNLITLYSYDCILCTMNPPAINAIPLLRSAKEKNNPFIFMVNVKADLPESEAKSLGANGYLPKPFSMEQILDILKKIIGTKWPKEVVAEEKQLDGEYSKIGIDEFLFPKSIKYPIYIRLSRSRYLKIAESGPDLTPERIKNYKSKGAEFG